MNDNTFTNRSLVLAWVQQNDTHFSIDQNTLKEMPREKFFIQLWRYAKAQWLFDARFLFSVKSSRHAAESLMWEERPPVIQQILTVCSTATCWTMLWELFRQAQCERYDSLPPILLGFIKVYTHKNILRLEAFEIWESKNQPSRQTLGII